AAASCASASIAGRAAARARAGTGTGRSGAMTAAAASTGSVARSVATRTDRPAHARGAPPSPDPGGGGAVRGRGPPVRTLTARRSALLLLLLLRLGVRLADLVHVQVLDLADEVLERGLRERAGLREHRDTLAVGDQGGDRGDAVAHRELLLILGVHLREGDVLVGLRGLLEDRGEALARHAPARPEVDQDDAVLDCLVVVLVGQGERSHDLWNAAAPRIIPGTP